jgi:hypothetical protein
LSEKSAVSSPEKRAEQRIKIKMMTSRMAKAAPVIIYRGMSAPGRENWPGGSMCHLSSGKLLGVGLLII